MLRMSNNDVAMQAFFAAMQTVSMLKHVNVG